MNSIHSPETVRGRVYMERTEEYKTYVIYDNSYLGAGYFIISELDGEIVKFAKIYTSSWAGFPYYNVRAFERDSFDQDWQQFRHIKITVNEDDELFALFSNLASELHSSLIKSIDPSNQGQNNMSATQDEKSATISFSKDVYSVKNSTGFIDINIGDDMICEQYEQISNFYKALARVNAKESSDWFIEKIPSLNKRTTIEK